MLLQDSLRFTSIIVVRDNPAAVTVTVTVAFAAAGEKENVLEKMNMGTQVT
jgi:hypothetical protein